MHGMDNDDNAKDMVGNVVVSVSRGPATCWYGSAPMGIIVCYVIRAHYPAIVWTYKLIKGQPWRINIYSR